MSGGMWRHEERRRGGFTALELVLAIALTSVVLLSAFGVLSMVRAADEATRDASGDAIELAYAQLVMRNAFGGLVAATPIPVEESDAEGLSQEEGAGGGDGIPPELSDRIEALMALQLAGAGAGVDPQLERAVATADYSEPPYFELWFTESDGVTLPRLRVVVTEAPTAFGRRGGLGGVRARGRDAERQLIDEWAGKIRGVFELLWGGDRGWLLAWTAESPAADPVVLIDDIVALEWEVLRPAIDESGDEIGIEDRADLPPVWDDVHAAYLQRDFPDAVRLILETGQGTRVDWLFETTAITQGGDDQ